MSEQTGRRIDPFLSLWDKYEGGGAYDTLFGFANKKGPFVGVDITQMSIGQLKQFSSSSGAYGRWTSSKLGYLATPMGRYQFVGSTMSKMAQAMGLSDDTLFTPDVQDAMAEFYMAQRLSRESTMDGKVNQLRGAWEGFKHVPREQLIAAIDMFEGREPTKFDPADVSRVSFAPGTASIPDFNRPGEVTQRFQQAEAQEAYDVGTGQVIKDAFASNDTAWLIRSFQRFEPDDKWQVASSERLQEDLKNVAGTTDLETYVPLFNEAVSEESYQSILAQVADDVRRQQRLQAAGLKGAGLQIAAAILDPVSIAGEVTASALTAGGATPILLANKARRVSRITHAAFAGGVAGFGSEMIGSQVNPHKDEMDILYGTVFGSGLGGLVGSLYRNPATESTAMRVEQIARRNLEDREAIGEFGEEVIGLGGNRPPVDLDKELFAAMKADDVPDTFLPQVRWDLHARLNSSKIPGAKAFSQALQDGVGKTNGAVNAFSVDEDLARLSDEFQAAAHRVYNPAVREYLQETGVSRMDIMGSRQAEAKFRHEIDRYIRTTDPSKRAEFPKSVQRTGQKFSQLYDEMLTLLQNPFHREGHFGRPVEGFDQVKRRENYAPRLWDDERVLAATQQHGKKKLQQLFMGAFRSANPDVEEVYVKQVGKAFYRALINRAKGLDEAGLRSIAFNDTDKFMRLLVDEGGMDTSAAEYVIKRLTPEGAGRDARAKRRIFLDETFEFEGLKLDDLYVTDALQLFSRYSNTASRLVALARFRLKDPETGQLIVDGLTSDKEWQTYLSATRKQGAELVESGQITKKQLDKDLKNLETAYGILRGRPPEWMVDEQWVRMLKDFNYTRIMNQVGFAQAPEAALIMSEVGVKASFSQIPAMRRIINSSGEEILSDPLTRDLEEFLALGTDALRAKSHDFFDDATGSTLNLPRDRMGQAEGLLRASTRVTANISGMNAINAFTQRWAAQGALQRLANLASEGKLTKADKRLRALGLDDAMTQRIANELNRPEVLETVPGAITGKKIVRFNMNAFSDLEAREALRAALYRQATTLVQRNFVGNSHPLFSKWWAKLLLQFRTFMLGAWAKQTLRSIYFRDQVALIAAMMSMASAGMAYTMQTHIQSIGRGDREEFLERRLAWDKVATAAYARSSHSSIIPMLLDTATYASGQDSLFSHTRTSGQVSNIFFGNPSMALFDDVPQATRGLINGLTQGGYSQEEARALLRVLPWGNALPVLLPFQKLISDLPEYRKDDK